MNVEVWADVVCPWCYIGKRNLDAALDLFAQRDQVTVIWRSFELDPHVTRDDDRPVVDVLAQKHGTSVEEVLVSQARVTALGLAAGIEFALDKTRNINSFDAHRLVQFSAKFGLQAEIVERLYAAHFTQGLRIDDHAVLAACASEVGIDADEATEVLSSGVFADDVRISENTARELGVRGVPFYVIDRKLAVSGAQAPDVLLDALNEALEGTNE
jgi:predicted DsbA family dithiol-disulfide isomerase